MDKKKIMLSVLLIGIVVMAIKFLAWYLTHSNAILTDALESIINVTAGSFALYSAYFASKPRDLNHPYGHGKIENLSAGFEGGLIFFAGIFMIYKSIVGFFSSPIIHSVDIGLYLTLAAGLVNYLMAIYLIKVGKRKHSLLLEADGKHLLSDAISSAGLVLGLVLLWLTKLAWIDQAMSVILGFYILYTGYKLVRASIINLLDEADISKLNQLSQLINKHRRATWIDIHNLRVLKYGNHLHVDCHLTLPWYQSLEVSHQEVSGLEALVRNEWDDEIEFFIHADPCLPTSCAICIVEGCAHRTAPFQQRIEWNLNNMLPDQKHKLDTPN